MGEAILTARELQRLVWEMMAEFPGNGYGLLTRNCNHFTAAFCERLVQRAPPAWINSAAATGAKVSRVVSRASSSVARLVKVPLRLQMRLSKCLLRAPSSARERWLGTRPAVRPARDVRLGGSGGGSAAAGTEAQRVVGAAPARIAQARLRRYVRG
ncbi:hypothetical protein T492DRAFT_398390 [Pavlovales sp. CCMP2436]|nr:hypothetical protein T492DRAFT_398390 [Pavlovales sp. CCMP2436]